MYFSLHAPLTIMEEKKNEGIGNLYPETWAEVGSHKFPPRQVQYREGLTICYR